MGCARVKIMEWIARVNGRVSGSDDCLHQCVGCSQLYWVGWDSCPNCGTSKYAQPEKNEEKSDDSTDQAK